MKKNFKYFGIVWIVTFILFNAVTFIVPAEIAGINRFEKPVFWISYALICVAFLSQLVSAYVVCNKNRAEKVFLHIPLLKIGYMAVGTSLVVGAVFMIIPVIPTWIGAIVCLLVAGVFIILAVRAIATANIVVAVGAKVARKTEFMRTAVVDAENIMARATTPEIKAETKKVYEALCYSDYMSCAELTKIEIHIEDHIEQLKIAVTNEDLEMVQAEVKELLLLIKERNSKCKMLK